MKAVIDADASVFTLINTFEVDPGKALDIVESLRGFTESDTQHMAGFVSASVHVSIDRTRVVNYVQWRSREDFEAMLLSPDARAHMAEVGTLAEHITPVVYGIAYVCDRQGTSTSRTLDE